MFKMITDYKVNNGFIDFGVICMIVYESKIHDSRKNTIGNCKEASYSISQSSHIIKEMYHKGC